MWLVYLLMILDNAKTLFGIVTGLSGACLFLFTILTIVGECENPERYDSFSDRAKIIFTAGSTIEYVQNNEKVQELPDKAVDCLNKFIDDYLNEDETR